MTTATSMAAAPTAASVATEGSQRFVVLGLCFATIVFDGYDLIVYGSVVPKLLEYEPWGLTPQRVGNIGSLALAGMLIGALAVGALTDLIGRRKVLLGCLVWFSLAMGACALAPSAGLFAVGRFLAGLGLGGVMPTTVALTVEYAPADRHHRYNAADVLRLLRRRDRSRRCWRSGSSPTTASGSSSGWACFRWSPSSRWRGGSCRSPASSRPPRKAAAAQSAVHRPEAGGQRPVPAGQLLRPAARLRAEHLAAQDHAEGRLPPDLVAGLPRHAQCRGGHRRAVRVDGGRPSRGQARDRGRIRRRRCRRPARCPGGCRSARSTSWWPPPGSARSAPRSSSTVTSPRTTAPTIAPRRWAGRWASAGSGRSSARRSAAGCWRRRSG